MTQAPEHKTLILACGALAKEVVFLQRALPDMAGVVDVQCLPADYHNTPEKIVPGLEKVLDERGADYDHILIGYGDCGTGGGLDRLLEKYTHVERMPGAHCYEFFAGHAVFADLMEEELGSFFLTDYLVRHFDRIVMKGLGLDRYPDLIDVFFKNYKRLVYLSQIEDADLLVQARKAADRLELELVHRHVGYGLLGTAINQFTPKEEALHA